MVHYSSPLLTLGDPQVLWAGLAGQETGNSLVDVLYGERNPSGRLPYTIAKQPSDYPAQLITTSNGSDILQIPYTEGCVMFSHSECQVSLMFFLAALRLTIVGLMLYVLS